MCEYIYQIISLLCYEVVTDFQCGNFHSWWDSTMSQCLHNYIYSVCNQCCQFSESEQIYDSTFLVYGFCFHYYWGSNIYVYMFFSGFVYEWCKVTRFIMHTNFCLYPTFGSEHKLFPIFILKFVSPMPWQPLINTYWGSTAYFLTLKQIESQH